MKLWGLLAVLIVFSLCISESPQETEPPTTTPYITETQTPTTLPPPTTPAPIDEELEYGKENLSQYATDYMRALDTNIKIDENEKYVGKTFDELVDKDITPEIASQLLDLSYKEVGRSDSEYLMENIDTSVIKQMTNDNILALYEKDLFKRIIELKDPNVIKQFDTNTAKKLDVLEGIHNIAKYTTDPAEDFFFSRLYEKLFHKIDGEFVGKFGNDGSYYISPQLRITENGQIEFYYFTDVLKTREELCDKWDKSLGNFYDKNGWPDSGWDLDFMEYFEKYVIGKDTGLPYNSPGGQKWFKVTPAMYNETMEKGEDIYTPCFAFKFDEIEDAIFYRQYEYRIPITKDETKFKIARGSTFSDIESYIYIYRLSADVANWGNIGIKDNKYILDMANPAIRLKDKWRAQIASFYNAEKFNWRIETNRDLLYFLGLD